MQELVVESLVVSLTMVMLDVLVDDEAQMPLAERDDTMEALFFDRPDEPLGIGVEIRTLRRQPDWPNIATCQDLATGPRVEGIAVMHQLAHGPQEAIDRFGQIAGHLLHPPAIGLRVDPGDVHTAGLQRITKKTKYRRRPASVSTSTVNRSAAARPSQCVCRNVFQGVRWFRSGAGASPWSCKIRLTGLCCNFRAATSGWTTFGKHRTGSPIMPSDNPFKWRQFEPALILQCVRWYLRYALSYRDLEDMMRERGLCVDHTTIYRWVQRYAPEIDKRCRPFLRRTNDSYRIDETYVRVAGVWTYLYRGVDSNGDTLDFLLRATRDRKAAIAFFRKTLGAAHPTPPRVVTVDKNPADPVAFEAVRHEGLVRPRSNLRQCKYLNNIIEQDHRFIKRRTRPMLGFKRFTTAWRTLRGIEIMHALRKGQARWMAKGDVVGQTQLIHKVFGLAA